MLKIHQLFANDGEGRIQLLGTYNQDSMIQKERELKDFKSTKQAYDTGLWRWVMMQEVCLDLETKTSTITILQEMCKDPPNIIELNVAAKQTAKPVPKKKPAINQVKVNWAAVPGYILDADPFIGKPQL